MDWGEKRRETWGKCWREARSREEERHQQEQEQEHGVW